MPNWCQNTLVVTGVNKELTRFKIAAQADQIHEDTFSKEKTRYQSALSFQELLPMPVELVHTTSPSKKPNKALIKKYGADNWYDWHNNNWGCKWDIDATLLNETKRLEYQFDSPWSPPVEGITAVSKLFPKLTFTLEFAEPGMGFAGRAVCKNGKLTEVGLPLEEVTDDMSY